MGQDPAGISRFAEIRKFDGTLKLRIRKKEVQAHQTIGLALMY